MSPSSGNLPPKYVLLSWVAVQTDPYERNRNGQGYVEGANGKIPGPTLTLLTDPESPYCGKVTDAVFFRQAGLEAPRHSQIYEDLVEAMEERGLQIRLHPRIFDGEDPTDHRALLDFLRGKLPEIRRKFPGRELLIHLSPGTPSMQTVWVLMASTGMIEGPVRMVKSYRSHDRRGRPAAEEIQLDIDTYFKRYQKLQPQQPMADGEQVGWGPEFRSPKALEMLKQARRVAGLKVPVLILGERGTGKTNLAGWIRLWSPFRKESLDRGWPAIACGQYSPETMRAELFGYRKGAFTGANADHAGLLKVADKDSLFLDEIGDISRDLQRLLIKALEEGRFQPLGSSSFEETDFRLLSATNRSLEELARQLDPDFVDRISPFVIHVPPLRELGEDLDWLWDRCLRTAAIRAKVPASYGHMTVSVRERLIAHLRRHPLPGNLRDLFKVAWTFLAARSDPNESIPMEDAATLAMAALEPTVDDRDKSRSFARHYADQHPLRDSFFQAGPFDPDPLWKAQQRWFAEEVEARAARSGQPREAITTVAERTLRGWRQNAAATSAENGHQQDTASRGTSKKSAK